MTHYIWHIRLDPHDACTRVTWSRFLDSVHKPLCLYTWRTTYDTTCDVVKRVISRQIPNVTSDMTRYTWLVSRYLWRVIGTPDAVHVQLTHHICILTRRIRYVLLVRMRQYTYTWRITYALSYDALHIHYRYTWRITCTRDALYMHSRYTWRSTCTRDALYMHYRYTWHSTRIHDALNINYHMTHCIRITNDALLMHYQYTRRSTRTRDASHMHYHRTQYIYILGTHDMLHVHMREYIYIITRHITYALHVHMTQYTYTPRITYTSSHIHHHIYIITYTSSHIYHITHYICNIGTPDAVHVHTTHHIYIITYLSSHIYHITQYICNIGTPDAVHVHTRQYIYIITWRITYALSVHMTHYTWHTRLDPRDAFTRVTWSTFPCPKKKNSPHKKSLFRFALLIQNEWCHADEYKTSRVAQKSGCHKWHDSHMWRRCWVKRCWVKTSHVT